MVVPCFNPLDTELFDLENNYVSRHYSPQLTDGENKGLERLYGLCKVTQIHARDGHGWGLIEKN